MTDVFVLVIGGVILLSYIVGYYMGRYQSTLVNELRTLREQSRQEPTPEPTKPTVITGAYQPPRDVSTSIDKKHKAGLVETKTPELLDWENKQEIEKLSTL